jgi:hypothetical protein
MAGASEPVVPPTLETLASEVERIKNKLNELIREHRALYVRVEQFQAPLEQKGPTKLEFYNRITNIDNLINQANRELDSYGETYISASPFDSRARCIDYLTRLKENRKMLMEMYASAKE